MMTKQELDWGATGIWHSDEGAESARHCQKENKEERMTNTELLPVGINTELLPVGTIIHTLSFAWEVTRASDVGNIDGEIARLRRRGDSWGIPAKCLRYSSGAPIPAGMTVTLLISPREIQRIESLPQEAAAVDTTSRFNEDLLRLAANHNCTVGFAYGEVDRQILVRDVIETDSGNLLVRGDTDEGYRSFRLDRIVGEVWLA